MAAAGFMRPRRGAASRRSVLAAVGAAALLSACAFWQPSQLVGLDRAQVVASMGTPSAEVVLPDGGVRLQYLTQPWGDTAWMVDLDGQGRVRQVYQALDNAHLQRIPVDGSWGADDVLREFGRAAFVDRVGSWNGDIWNYRWRDGVQYMFYYIYFDPEGRVRRAHGGIDFTRERDNDFNTR